VNTQSKLTSFETLYRFLPELILFVYIILFFSIKQPYNDYDRIISSDGKAYYGYLTAIFIYHDLDYNFVDDYEQKYYPEDKSQFKEFRFKFKGEIVNKAFPGLAILLLPFFLLAHVLALIFGFTADGYSLIYQNTMGIGALFYLWLGLRLLKSLLASFQFSSKNIASILILLAFATNLIYYTINEGMMAHVYNFMLITLFLLAIRKFIDEKGYGWLILSALSLGLIISARPTNALVIFLIPLIVETPSRFAGLFRKVFSDWKSSIMLVVAFLVFPFLVLLLYKLQTGYWLVYSYGDEGFNFADPHFFQILFSFNKGWFIYTPIALISLFGLIPLYRKSRFAFYSTLIFFVLFAYIASSWWVWHYTSNFGQRVFIDIYALVAILLGYFFQSVFRLKLLRFITMTIVSLLLVLNCLQYYQHYNFIFAPGTVDAALYRDSFFRLVPAPKYNFPEELVESNKVLFNDFEEDYDWLNYASVTDTLAFEGKFVSRPGFVNEYSIGLYEPLNDLLTTDFGWVKVGFWMYSDRKYSKGTLVVDIESVGKSIFYKPFFMREYNIRNEWTYLEFAIKVPDLQTSNDMLRVYFMLQPGDELFLVDNLKVEVISMKEDFEFY
jgi:hypothetical protein